MSQNIDLGGNTLICEDLKVGATAPGQAGTSISSTELGFIDGVTAGTATASKAVVLGASKEIATITTATITNLTTTTLTPTTIAGGSFSATPVLATGTTLDVASATATCTGTGGTSTATMTEYASQVTTAALTTAAGSAHVITITKTGVASTDLAFCSLVGGTNTRDHIQIKAACTTDTITVTISNIGPTNAVNGTHIFNIWVVKP